MLFFDAVKPPGCISWPVWRLMGINKIALGAKLILMADLAYPMSCVERLYNIFGILHYDAI